MAENEDPVEQPAEIVPDPQVAAADARIAELLETNAQLTASNSLLSNNMAMVQANQQTQAAPAAVEDPYAELSGMDDQDVPTGKQIADAMSRQDQRTSQIMRDFAGQVAPQLNHPDYGEVVRTHLPAVMENNPALQQSLRGLDKGAQAEMVYALASAQAKVVAAQTAKPTTPEAQAAADEVAATLERQNLPGSASAVAGAANQGQNQKFAEMSNAEIDAFSEKMAQGG